MLRMLAKKKVLFNNIFLCFAIPTELRSFYMEYLTAKRLNIVVFILNYLINSY